MPQIVWLSETQSAALQMLLVLGLALVMPAVVDRLDNRHRAVLMMVSVLLALRYAWWRGSETLAPFGFTIDCLASWSLFALELGALASSISGSLLMSRIRERKEEADDNAEWWSPDPAPRAAVLIATYNEDREILERSIVGALALDWPEFEVFVLDDGRRDWLRDFCAARGARYVTRPDNKGAKAGNINHGLELLEDEGAPEFFAVLDADFVPHRNFLRRTLALFHDPKAGLVQTPQHFFNADPIQHNLGLSRSYPDEQRFFFDHMQPARDGWGMAICCGTSSVARWQAVSEVGGLPTDSVTEDFLLTLALQERGWETHYLNEPLTEGLAPEGLKEYITQRARWCLGLMQIARGRLGPLARNGLRLRDRWSVVDSAFFWLTTYPFRLAAFVYPLLYWYFNITVVDAEVPDVLSYFGVYFLWTMVAFNLLSPGMLVPMLKDVSQHLGAIQISRAAVTGILKPRGHPFSVTAKGGDRSRLQIQWRLMAPYLVLTVLTVVALLLGVVSDRFAFYDAGDGKAVVLFWTIYNLFVLSLILVACVELPRRERHVADRPERAIFAAEGDVPRRIWIASLARDTARIRGRTWPGGTRGILRIPSVGDIEATVMTASSDGARLLLVPDEATNQALLRRFYTEGGAPGVVGTSPSAIFADLARRLTFDRSA
ncbi:glycosyltransferase [Tranquillimonas alkanivorans]|uniref:Cellulose synthase (UDP-forming) n=1 Tax=Tranquillimonas alkanivorans TaxID=441119 RepID=A0A1I5VG57_9RHOB|nr:glycosyltransferase [Tranquillimonas alkanivorans]SFQ06449.1 cellulose synthase (UDP-forming) [Tranquillimonas alkanivorans]